MAITSVMLSPVRPDSEFMSRRFGEMEPAPARKREDRFDDDRTMLPDQPFARCQIEAVKDNQRAAETGAACQIGRIDPAIKPGPVKGKIGTILLELPTEGGGKKARVAAISAEANST